MKEHLLRFKEKIARSLRGSSEDDEMYTGQDYVEIDTGSPDAKKSKVVIRPFIIEEFGDIKETLDAIREGYTVALINIKPIKDRDIIELKRAVNKLKKTCDAIGGDIAGFGEDWIVITPSFAEIYRTKQTEDIKEEQ